MQKSIFLHDLPLITDPDTFFNFDKVLSVDVVDFTDLPPLQKLKLQINKRAIKFNDKLFFPLLLKGSPSSWYSYLTKGIRYDILPGEQSWLVWDGDLQSAIAKKKFYDISAYYRTKDIEFMFEHGWIYERFVQPYEHKPLKRKCLNYHYNNTGIIQASAINN